MDKLYYTIGEVSEMIGVNSTVLRFWETEFKEIRPTKNQRGFRVYKKEDIDLIRQIYHLTRECGLTLEGAKEHLRAGRTANDDTMQVISSLTEVRQFLCDLKDQL